MIMSTILRWRRSASIATAALLLLACPSSDKEVTTIEAVQGNGPMSRDEVVLEWIPVLGVKRYEVTLGDCTNRPPCYYDSAYYKYKLVLSANFWRGIPDGESFPWSVVAVMPDGRRIESETFLLTLVSSSP